MSATARTARARPPRARFAHIRARAPGSIDHTLPDRASSRRDDQVHGRARTPRASADQQIADIETPTAFEDRAAAGAMASTVGPDSGAGARTIGRYPRSRESVYLPAMSALEFVDLSTARAAPGVRIVVSGLVPSPWSEATKGLFRLASVPVRAVRRMRDTAEVTAWTGVDNVPVVFHDAEPARTSWVAITALAARLAGPDVVLPDDTAARAETIGLLHEIAGEEGIGWNARLAMIDATIKSGGKRGFPLPVGQYLAARYGYTPDAGEQIRPRIERQLHMVRDRLVAQQALGHDYLGGAKPSALDIYVATFLTPLSVLSADDCPLLEPRLRSAFSTAHEELGALVPEELFAHRLMVLERHLGWPIAL